MTDGDDGDDGNGGDDDGDDVVMAGTLYLPARSTPFFCDASSLLARTHARARARSLARAHAGFSSSEHSQLEVGCRSGG